MSDIDALQIWKKSHWVFSVYIQALIICLLRFEISLQTSNFTAANTELETATDLILASAAIMELAGSFSKYQYNQEVRLQMTPPHVQSDNFSGIMHWDHAYLVNILKRLSPVFKDLPSEIRPQQEKFMLAYKTLFTSHKEVCQKFGGDESGSLRSQGHTALDILSKFEKNRLRLIATKINC